MITPVTEKGAGGSPFIVVALIKRSVYSKPVPVKIMLAINVLLSGMFICMNFNSSNVYDPEHKQDLWS